MPIVRRVREIEQAPIPGVRKTAAETANSRGFALHQAEASKGEAIAQFGGIGARIGIAKLTELQKEERDKADQIAALAFDNKFAKWEASRLYDPETGALSQKGKNALGLPEQIDEEFTKLSGEIEATASTDRQREAFQRIKSQRQQGLNVTVRRHVFGEMQAYGREELAGTVENAHNAAVAKALDPDAAAIEMDRGVAALTAVGPKLGLGPAALEKQIGAFQSKTIAGVVTRLVNNDLDKQARAYLDDAKEKGLITDGDLIGQLEKALDVSTTREESQRQADAILAKGGTLAEQRAEAKAITDGELRDQVTQRLEHEAMIQAREKNEEQQQTMRSAYDVLDRTANVNKIPAATWATFDGSTRAAMRSYAEHKVKGTPVATDWPTYYRLTQQAMDDPETFASSETNLLQYRHQLDDVEFKQLVGLKMSLASGNRNAAEKDLSGLRTTRQIIDDTLPQYKIPTTEKDQSPADVQAIAQLRRQVDQALADEFTRTGKKADAVFVQKTVDQMLSASVIKQTDAGIYQWAAGSHYTQQRLLNTTITDVPASQRASIITALQNKGRPVNDAAIVDLYIKFMLRQQQK